jgi:hypothetical protein
MYFYMQGMDIGVRLNFALGIMWYGWFSTCKRRNFRPAFLGKVDDRPSLLMAAAL